MRKDKNDFWAEGILLALIVGCFLAALGILLPNWCSARRDRQGREALQALRSSVSAVTEPQDNPIQPETQPAVTQSRREEILETEPAVPDFLLKLHCENPDFAGWLKGGSNIDYPVMLRGDNYYLNRDFFGNSDPNGTLFLNDANSIQPRDDVLLIHGHAMNSGAMFGKLADFSSSDYVKENPIFSFQTIFAPTPVYYTPFAAFHASMMPEKSDYYPLVQLSFPQEKNGERPEYQAYLEEIQKRNILNLPIHVSTDDELLVLVTCSYYNDDGRFMVFCRKLHQDETPETVELLYANEKINND